MTLKSLMICDQKQMRLTTRDSLIGAGVMIAATMFFVLAGLAAKLGGWPETGELILSLAFPASLTVSMPFWLMKGQPWKAQAVIVGATLVMLILIGCLAAMI